MSLIQSCAAGIQQAERARLRPRRRQKAFVAASYLAAGAALMYYFDPDRGRRRRALARDKFAHLRRVVTRKTQATARDIGHRVQGAAMEATTEVLDEVMGEAVLDDVLVQRVRAEMGHVIRHPHAVEVSAYDGHVVLRGAADPDEIDRLLARTAAVPGVVDVEDRLRGIEPPWEADLAATAGERDGPATRTG